jgi:hypothetical protein
MELYPLILAQESADCFLAEILFEAARRVFLYRATRVEKIMIVS